MIAKNPATQAGFFTLTIRNKHFLNPSAASIRRQIVSLFYFLNSATPLGISNTTVIITVLSVAFAAVSIKITLAPLLR